MRRPHLPLVAAAVLLSSAFAQANEGGIPWRPDAQAAIAEAQQTGKMVLMHFWTESCGPCRLLEKRVFTQPGVAGAIVANYVPVKINAAESPELARAYGVTRVPTDVVTDSRGQLIRSFVSPATPMGYVGQVTEVASEQRSQASPYAELAAQAPAPYTLGQGTTPVPPVNPVQAPAPGMNVAGMNVPGMNTASPMTSAPGASPVASPAPQVALNPNYQPVAEAAPQVSQGPVQPVAPVASVATTPMAPVQATPTQVTPAPAAPTQVAQSPVADAPATEAAAPLTAELKLPPGSPPVAFDGYCSVTMKKNWEWKRGDVRFGAIHRGRTYLFASAEKRDEFLATPDDFAPALSGSDPVMAIDSRQNVPGSRQYAVEYRGRFYFFASEETLSKFWTNADGYATGAERIAAGNTDTVIR